MGELDVRNVVRHVDLSVVRDFLKDVFTKDLRKEWKEPEGEPDQVVAETDLQKLLQLLREGDAPRRRKVVQLLAELGDAARRAIPELLQLLRSPNESKNMRDEVAKALGEIGAPGKDDFPALVAALTDRNAPDGRARLYAADALGKFKGQGRQVAEVLVKALDDPELDVRKSAVSALGKIGWASREEVFAGLIKAVKDK